MAGGEPPVPRWTAGLTGPIVDRVAAAVARAGPLPVLDATVQRLLELLEDPTSSTGAVVALIEQDPEFAAQLLRLANSAYYARRSTWKTVRQALAAVGRAAAGRLCVECATYRFLERAPGNGRASRGQLHTHAVTVATLASELARRGGVEVESAHLGGLLHDFGKLVMPLAFGEQPLDELAREHPYGIDRASVEWERFGIDHAHAGALYARECGLDEQVCAAIAYHHGGRSGVRVPSPLAAAVQVAEALAAALHGVVPDWTLIDEALPHLTLERDALDEVALRASGVALPTQAHAEDTAGRVAELERLAHTDDLTGVASRRAWIDHARGQLAAHHAGTLLLCDVDRLKLVNDTHGHAAGDALLAQLGTILTQYGFAGRLGGDEFALWLPATPPPHQIAGTILARTTEAFAWTDVDGHTAGLSIGLASAPADATDLAALLELADTNLYTAKRAAGSRTTQPIPADRARRHHRDPPH